MNPDGTNLQYFILAFAFSISMNVYFLVNRPFAKLMRWIDNKTSKDSLT